MTATSKGKPFPVLTSDEAAEHFVDTADLSEYDFSTLRPAHEFEFYNKSSRVNMRLAPAQLQRLKEAAAKRGIPYQRFIREAIELALERDAVAERARNATQK